MVSQSPLGAVSVFARAPRFLVGKRKIEEGFSLEMREANKFMRLCWPLASTGRGRAREARVVDCVSEREQRKRPEFGQRRVRQREECVFQSLLRAPSSKKEYMICTIGFA